MAKENYDATGLTIKDAIQVLLDNDLTELFNTMDEVIAARCGEATLQDKELIQDTAAQTVIDEVEAARGGEVSLQAKELAQDTATQTIVEEVETARDGEPTLLEKEQAQDTAIQIVAEEVGTARDGKSTLLEKEQAQDTATQIVVNEVEEARDGRVSLLEKEQAQDNEVVALKSQVSIGEKNNYYFPDPLEADQGVNGNGFTIKDCIDAVGSKRATIFLKHNSIADTTVYTVSTDLTIPENICFMIENGAIVSVDDGKVLTINGAFEAGLYQVFSEEGNVNLEKAQINYIIAEWYGTGTTDDSIVLKKVIENSILYNIPCKLTRQSYTILSPVIISHTNTNVNAPIIIGKGNGGPGAATGQTTIYFSSAVNGIAAISFSSTDNSMRGLKFKNISIRKTGTGTGTGQTGLLLDQMHSFNLTNVKVGGFYDVDDTGIEISNCWEGSLNYCYAPFNRTGLKFTPVSTVINIVGGSFKACDVGILFTGGLSVNISIQEINLESCTTTGIKVDSQLTLLSLQNVHLEDSKLPLDLKGVNQATLHGFFSLNSEALNTDPICKIEDCKGIELSGYVYSANSYIYQVIGNNNSNFSIGDIGDNLQYMKLQISPGNPWKNSEQLIGYKGNLTVNADPFMMMPQLGESYRTPTTYPIGVRSFNNPGMTREWTTVDAYVTDKYVWHITTNANGFYFAGYEIPVVPGQLFKVCTIAKGSSGSTFRVQTSTGNLLAQLSLDSTWSEKTLVFTVPDEITFIRVGWAVTDSGDNKDIWVHSMHIQYGIDYKPAIPNPLDVIRKYSRKLTNVGTTGVTINLPINNSNYLIAATPERATNCWVERNDTIIVVKTDDTGDSDVVNVIILPLSEISY